MKIIIDDDGIPCIVVDPGTLNEEKKPQILIVDFTAKQIEKEGDFLTEIIEELEKLFKEVDFDASEE